MRLRTVSATNFNMSLSKINKLAFRAARAHSGVLLYRECCCRECCRWLVSLSSYSVMLLVHLGFRRLALDMYTPSYPTPMYFGFLPVWHHCCLPLLLPFVGHRTGEGKGLFVHIRLACFFLSWQRPCWVACFCPPNRSIELSSALHFNLNRFPLALI